VRCSLRGGVLSRPDSAAIEALASEARPIPERPSHRGRRATFRQSLLAGPLRVLSYNIWNGGEDRLPLIEAVIRAQRPDAVALVEANDRAAVEGLAGRLGMELAYGEANSPFAVAWLSALPVRATTNHRLPILEKTLLELDVADVRLFATHLRAGRTERDSERRTAEVAAILGAIGDGDCLLVGDLNAVNPIDLVGIPPPEERLEFVAREPVELLLDAGFADCFRLQHPSERGWTYLTWHPWARLDYVLARGEVAGRLRSCDVVAGDDALRASDHLPVVAEFDYPNVKA
jgi:exodeoxyribonuclease III